jgi:hypothetical protein
MIVAGVGIATFATGGHLRFAVIEPALRREGISFQAWPRSIGRNALLQYLEMNGRPGAVVAVAYVACFVMEMIALITWILIAIMMPGRMI